MPSSVPSSVHTEETTLPFSSYETYGECLRHSCVDRYSAAEAVYSYLDDLNDSSKRWRLESCRSNAWFLREVDSGLVRVASNSCHLRWCPLCADSRRAYISFSVSEWLAKQAHPKFLTLTLKHSEAPLDFQIDCLYRCFQNLRKCKEFKRCVPGGIWFFQVKRSKNDGLWHPHLHCLISGLYIPHSFLSRTWLRITRSSDVVDIRPVRDPSKAANDAARYAACPGSLLGLPFEKSVELVLAMHGRRICGTWGTARNVSLRAPKAVDKHKWQNIGSWASVVCTYDSDANARAILDAWRFNNPLPAGISLASVDSSIDGRIELDPSDYDYSTFPGYERSPP